MILSIDTTNKNIRIILQKGDKLVDKIAIDDAKNQAESLVLDIEKILKTNDIWYNDINAFSVVSGPGTFTGLKIAISVVKALKSVFQETPVIVNNIFEIMAFKKNFDFIILRADINGCYVCDCNNKMNYMKNNEIALLFENYKLKFNRVITNRKDLVDFINKKTLEKLAMKNIIEYNDIESDDLIALNDYKFKNKLFSKDIFPIYLRDPQINRKSLNK